MHTYIIVFLPVINQHLNEPLVKRLIFENKGQIVFIHLENILGIFTYQQKIN